MRKNEKFGGILIKIGLIGTGCAGKTTLSKQLAEYFNWSLVEECARRYDKNELHNSDNEKIQYELVLDQIRAEILTKNNMISDRTIIDPFIYLERKGHRPRKHLLHLIRSWVETYDLILLCKKLPFIDDGFREDDLDIEDDIINFMKCNLISYEVIEGNETERFLKAVKIIKGRIQNGMHN